MKVSVILQALQTGQVLESQFASITNQEHQPDELVVITDPKNEQIQAQINQFKNQQSVELIYIDSSGPQALREALRLVSGEVILFIEHPIQWKSNKIQKIHDLFFEEPLIRMIFSNAEVISNTGQVLVPDFFGITGFYEHWDFFKELTSVLLKNSNFVPLSFIAIDRKFLNKILGFMDEYPTYLLPIQFEQFVAVLFGLFYEPEFLKEIPYVLNQIEPSEEQGGLSVLESMKPLSMSKASKWTKEEKLKRFQEFKTWLANYRDLVLLVNSKHPIVGQLEQNIDFQSERIEQLNKGRATKIFFAINNLLQFNYKKFSSEPWGDFTLDLF